MPRTGTTGIIASLVFFAIGAILHWGIADSVDGVSLETIGLILMGLSAVGLVLSLGGWFADRSEAQRPSETDTIVDDVHRRTIR